MYIVYIYNYGEKSINLINLSKHENWRYMIYVLVFFWYLFRVTICNYIRWCYASEYWESFLKTWEKKFGKHHMQISHHPSLPSIKSSVHILVSSCYNSYGVLEISMNSWRHKNQLLVSKLEILHGFNLACWFQMLAPYPLLPSILQEIVRCFSFSYVFLGHKNSVRHVSESHSLVDPNWRKSSFQKSLAYKKRSTLPF